MNEFYVLVLFVFIIYSIPSLKDVKDKLGNFVNDIKTFHFDVWTISRGSTQRLGDHKYFSTHGLCDVTLKDTSGLEFLF